MWVGTKVDYEDGVVDGGRALGKRWIFEWPIKISNIQIQHPTRCRMFKLFEVGGLMCLSRRRYYVRAGREFRCVDWELKVDVSCWAGKKGFMFASNVCKNKVNDLLTAWCLTFTLMWKWDGKVGWCYGARKERRGKIFVQVDVKVCCLGRMVRIEKE